MALLITILPSIIILAYFILSDKFKEPKRIIIEVFILGVASTFPAAYLNTGINNFFSSGEVINDALLTGFFAGGFVEETLKYLILYYIVLRKKEFNEPMDGIVYGVVVSLGFATEENFSYVYQIASAYNIPSIDMAIARSYSAVPMHGLNGCVMGFYFGLYAFKGQKKYLGYALLIPILFHGSYNFLIGIGTSYHYLILVILLFMSFGLHKKLKLLQIEKNKENEKKLV